MLALWKKTKNNSHNIWGFLHAVVRIYELFHFCPGFFAHTLTKKYPVPKRSFKLALCQDVLSLWKHWTINESEAAWRKSFGGKISRNYRKGGWMRTHTWLFDYFGICRFDSLCLSVGLITPHFRFAECFVDCRDFPVLFLFIFLKTHLCDMEISAHFPLKIFQFLYKD